MGDWTDNLEVLCADIGSIARNNFGWAGRSAQVGVEVHDGDDITALVEAVIEALAAGKPVALGFEAPMFVPVPEDPHELAKKRPTDVGAPAWCSPPGSNVLTQAIVQTPWILQRIHARFPDLKVFFEWDPFAQAKRGLLLWEAFVSGKAKGEHHQHDAQIAILRFVEQLPQVGDTNAKETERRMRSTKNPPSMTPHRAFLSPLASALRHWP